MIESASPSKTITTNPSAVQSFVRFKAGLVSVEWITSSALRGLDLFLKMFYVHFDFRQSVDDVK